jgi:multidrug resistance efflux pump
MAKAPRKPRLDCRGATLIGDCPAMARRSSHVRGLAPALLSIALSLIATPPLGALAQSRNAAFTAPGFVEPSEGILSIGTAATGIVERVVAGPGEHVRQGQELIKIDCAPLEAEVRALAGLSAAAQAVADRVRHGSRAAEIAVGEANLGVARARAEEAVDALRRAQALQVGTSVTQAAVLLVQRDARITSAQLEDARAKLDLLRSGSRGEDIAEADAQRDAAAAALEEAKAKLAQCSVASPIEGVVVARFVSQGQFVSAAVPAVLMQIENDRSFAIRAEVEEAHLADLCAGQRASIALPGEANASLTGAVERIAPLVAAPPLGTHQGEAPPGHVAVTLKLDQQKPGLLAGEQVAVRLEPCHS